MRLWHKDLVSFLPRKQLLGQHREIAALRGKGWGKKHSVVDYVFKHPYSMLFVYHVRVMDEMKRRGYNVADEWRDMRYQGKTIGYDMSDFTSDRGSACYPEHDAAYMDECLGNLKRKGVDIKI